MANLLDLMVASLYGIDFLRPSLLRLYDMGGVFDGLRMMAKGPVLEVGCSLGFAQYFFDHVAYTGIDMDIGRVGLASKMPRKGKRSFKVARAEGMAFPSRSFSMVIMKSVLHHLNDPVPVLKEAKRVLKQDGQLVIIEPRPHWYDWVFDLFLEGYFRGYCDFPQTKNLYSNCVTILKKDEIDSIMPCFSNE